MSIFVLATDTDQLACSIKAVYGHEFDAERYLKRFFNRTYSFAEPSIENFIRYRLERRGLDLKECDFHSVQIDAPASDQKILTLASICKSYNLKLRDIEQCIEILEGFLSGWPYKGLNIDIQLAVVFSQIIAFHELNREASLQDAIDLNVKLREARKSKGYFEFQGRFGKSPNELASSPNINLDHYLGNFQQIMNDISKVEQNSNNRNWSGLINRSFMGEYQARYKNARLNGKFSSVMVEYSRLIAQAGRLSAEIAKSDDAAEYA